jgi:hypothetical protein
VLFLMRSHVRLFRSGLSDIDDAHATPAPIRAELMALDAAIDRHIREAALAA